MKKWIYRAVLLLAVFCLAGCQKETAAVDGYRIYYTNSQGTKLTEEAYVPEAQDAQGMAEEFLAKLSEMPEALEERTVKPEGVNILSVTVEGSKAAVDFDAGYQEIDSLTEVLLRAAVVKTLVQIPDITQVEFTINGKALTDPSGELVGAMDQNTFIDTIEESGINSTEQTETETESSSETESSTDTEVLEPSVGVDSILKNQEERNSK